MRNQILEPLKYYERSGKNEHEANAIAYFDELLEKSKVNVEENRKTAKEYRSQASYAETLLKRVKSLRGWKIFLIILICIGFLCIPIGLSSQDSLIAILVPIIGLVVAVGLIVLLSLKINPAIKQAQSRYDIEKAKADALLKKAESQTAPLNALFTERDALELIEKTMQGIVKFSPDYSMDLEDEFVGDYGFVDDITSCCSVLDTLAGRLYDNPFVFFRYKRHEIGSKTYHGSRVISYYVTVRGSDGKTRQVLKTQTLHASVTKPYPYYYRQTALGYGHQSAPDLSFSRTATDVETLTERQVEKRVSRGEKKLKKLAEKSLTRGGDFTEMTNAEFDVLFGATNRNHEVQFRMLFSPLAQNNMVDLLCNKSCYGDDFDFYKRGRYNRITSEHAQVWDMDASPENYFSYDVDLIKNKFVTFNNAYFKSVFFDFAPLLTIPSYHQPPAEAFKPLKRTPSNNTYYEHEALVNAIGKRNFAHPQTATDVIL